MELERQLRFATEEQGPEFNAHNNTTQHNTTATTNSSAVVLCAFILGLGRQNWKDPWGSPASEPQAKEPVSTNKWMTSEENDT